MSFLQPMLLVALPLVGLPVLIHLINQRRYQTVRWGAMMFLLAANRMSRGYARLRQWLIMAFRMLAIVGLIVAVSRPLAGGWLGLAAGGRPDTTIVLLDRSPSMEQGGAEGGGSKRATGLRQIARAVETLGSSRWVLIESGTYRPREFESAAALPHAAGTGPTGAAADIPALLQAARDAIRASKAGRTEIWICSDLRANDWNPESGRWPALRDAFLQFPQGVRFHLLAYPQTAPGNLGVRVTAVRRQQGKDGGELLVSLAITREAGADVKRMVPVQFEVDGARSEVTIEMVGQEYQLKDHRIPLGADRARGWARVSIPADANPADNEFWFLHDEPPTRRALIVAEDPQVARTLEFAAAIAPESGVRCEAQVVAAEDLATVAWDSVALLLWQAPLPLGEAAARVRAFIERGGSAIFFPPSVPGESALFGVRWTSWMAEGGKATAPGGAATLTRPSGTLSQGERVLGWRGDEDLLAQTQSGAPLPLGTLQVRRACGLAGELTPLATLGGGTPLLARATMPRGGAYFCATTPAAGDSSLAADGVVLYVMVQRALAAGAVVLGSTRAVDAGVPPSDLPAQSAWQRVAGAELAISTEYPLHPGVYTAGGKLLAVNRPAAEDAAAVLANRRVAELFRGLDYARIDDRAGSMSSLVQEVWRLFLVAMMAALVIEAALCLPGTRTRPAAVVVGRRAS
jgi:hypothetical protein